MNHSLFGLVVVVLLSPFSLLHAQTPCGNIIIPPNFWGEGSEVESVPIENCANPFERTHPLATFQIRNADITENSTHTVEQTGLSEYGFVGENYYNQDNATYYRHEGSDYIQTKVDFSEPTNEAQSASITEFFGGPSARETSYREAYFSGDTYDFFQDSNGELYIDGVTGTYVYEVFEEMESYVQTHAQSSRLPLLPGTYTVVRIDTDEGPSESFNTETPLKQIFASLIPTAYAYYNVLTVTFTLEVAQEPQGASNVLFLPGIMGSRLYEESAACALFGIEQQRWVSTTDCEQLRLRTNVQGNSINAVYTKSGNDPVISEVFGLNLYKTFFNTLDDWKSEQIINNYAAVAYDWRLRLDDLLKTKKDQNTGKIIYDVTSSVEDSYLYETLSELAASSTTGKVTIVAHSNGGLLAKAFLATLKINNDPLADKVDNLILVASPQVGTPGTLLGMLHGDEIGQSGVVVSQQTTRQLMNSMPFAFHLLPNASYFNSTGVTVDTPVLTFESGTLTTPWVNIFGTSITTAQTLKTFLSTESGRTKPSVEDLATPEVVDTFLFNYTSTIDQLMDNWVPPATMKVYQVAGVGLPTNTGLTYFTDSECISRDILKLFKCTAYTPKLGMRPNETIDGDKTVVTPSALAMSETYPNVERWWLNLKNYNNDVVINRVHKDIFEVQDVINFVRNTLLATTSLPYTYLTSIPAVSPQEKRLVFNLHSPLDLKIMTSTGKEISSSTETIEGGVYNRYGEMQHISVPDTGETLTLKLQGTASGSFTLEIEEHNGTQLDIRHTYSAIPSSISTKVTMVLDGQSPLEQVPLVVDYDGNGTPEITYNTEGEIMPEITYTTLLNSLNTLAIKSLYKKLLLENAKIAKFYYEKSLTQITYKQRELLALRVLKQQVLLYERLRVLNTVQKQELVRIINGLISK